MLQKRTEHLLLGGLILLISLFIFRDYLFLKDLYIFRGIGSDTLTQFFPDLLYYADYIRTDGIPMWSFHQGLGQNVMGLALSDPFHYILFAMGRDNLPYGIVYMEVLKLLLFGFCFFSFLRLHRFPSKLAIGGALLLSFSGFMILGGSWYVFSAQGLYFCILLYGLEDFFRKGRWIFISLGVALLSLRQPFDVIPASMLILFYTSARFFYTQKSSVKEHLTYLIHIFWTSLLGFLVTLPISFNKLLQILSSPRVGGESSNISGLIKGHVFGLENLSHYVSVLFRSLSSDLLGSGHHFRGWQNYLESPLFYCGIITLLLVPQGIALSTGHRKKVLSILLGLAIFPVIFPFFRHGFWLFAGDYYRLYSYYWSILLICIAMFALKELVAGKKIHRTSLLISVLVISGILFFPFYPEKLQPDSEVRLVVFNFLLAHSTVLFLHKKLGRRFPAIVLLLISAEAAGLSWYSTSRRSPVQASDLTTHKGYNDYTLDAVSFLKERDPSFYRLQKDYYSAQTLFDQSINDPKAQGFYGSTCYNSFNQKYFLIFQQKMGIIDLNSKGIARWPPGVYHRPFLQNLVSIKYKLSRNPAAANAGFGYRNIGKKGDVHIFENEHFLPFGFCYSSFIREDSLLAIPKRFDQDKLLLKAAALRPEQIEKFKGLSTVTYDNLNNYQNTQLSEDIQKLKYKHLKISKFSQNNIIGSINLDAPRLLCFSMSYDSAWRVNVDGQQVPLERINFGLSGIYLEKGVHQIELKFLPPHFYKFLLLAILAFLTLVFVAWNWPRIEVQ